MILLLLRWFVGLSNYSLSGPLPFKRALSGDGNIKQWERAVVPCCMILTRFEESTTHESTQKLWNPTLPCRILVVVTKSIPERLSSDSIKLSMKEKVLGGVRMSDVWGSKTLVYRFSTGISGLLTSMHTNGEEINNKSSTWCKY